MSAQNDFSDSADLHVQASCFSWRGGCYFSERFLKPREPAVCSAAHAHQRVWHFVLRKGTFTLWPTGAPRRV